MFIYICLWVNISIYTICHACLNTECSYYLQWCLRLNRSLKLVDFFNCLRIPCQDNFERPNNYNYQVNALCEVQTD